MPQIEPLNLPGAPVETSEITSSLEDAPYRNPAFPIEDRVADLIGRMTLLEKARQLDLYMGKHFVDRMRNETMMASNARFEQSRAEDLLGDAGVGAIHDLYPPSSRVSNAIQRWLRTHSRLGIPALFAEEALHGVCSPGHTAFSQAIGLAATWNTGLMEQVGAVIGSELRASNIHLAFAPVLDVARDPRWGRLEETYGEDPYMVSQIGTAFIRGMQGETLASDHTVAAEPKHFAGHGAPEGGRNMAPLHMGPREIAQTMLPPFEAAVRECGVLGIMCAYHEVDGIPCIANNDLLTRLLREEWGFEGIVLSDLGAIRRLLEKHYLAETPADAVRQALAAGVDMQYYDFDHKVFEEEIASSVEDGSLSIQAVDQAVSRVLRLKFRLGLFDNPMIDEELAGQVKRCPEHMSVNLQAARESICLLKNTSLLPLPKDLRRVAVVGPNAARICAGDYAGGGDGKGISLVAGIQEIVSASTAVLYVDESATNGDLLARSLSIAQEADVVIAALGEPPGLSGEGMDRSEIGLPKDQMELLQALHAIGKPVVLVLMNGRPLTIGWAAEHIPAIVEAWYPAELGGRALAEVLFGDYNPAGRLPVTFPRSVGQIPLTYNRKPSSDMSYVDQEAQPLFPFGHGLSFTQFEYTNLSATPRSTAHTEIAVSVDVKNTGTRDGDEVVQLYIRDVIASVTTPMRSLQGFKRIHLKAGEQVTVSFALAPQHLSLVNRQMTRLVEPGEFEIYVGGSSDASLSATVAVPAI
jgi:beta-glucosidase